MAKNMIYKYTEKDTRTRTLDGPTDAGVPLLDPADARPAVTLTATGVFNKTVTTATIPMGGGVSSITYNDGSVGNDEDDATLAYDGVWEFAVDGADTETVQGAEVFIDSSGDLTLTEGTNTHYGFVDYPKDFYKRDGVLPVRVGD